MSPFDLEALAAANPLPDDVAEQLGLGAAEHELLGRILALARACARPCRPSQQTNAARTAHRRARSRSCRRSGPAGRAAVRSS